MIITNQKPLFSILVANYNNGKYIDECILSVKNQSYDNWEIIIVDDCSTDDSIEIINRIQNNDSRIIIHEHKSNQGCGAAKRKCLDFANGEVCGFLDPDDVLHQTAIEKMVEKHIEFPEVSMVHSQFYLCDSNLEVSGIANWSGAKPENQSQITSKTGQQITHFCSFKIKKYQDTDGIDPILKRAVDQDLYTKLEETGATVFINEPLYYYRQHDGSISLGVNLVKARYWSYRVSLDTYYRRKKKKGEIRNISYGYLQRLYLDICLQKIEIKLKSCEFRNLLYFYCQISRLVLWDKEMRILKIHLRFLKSLALRLFNVHLN